MIGRTTRLTARRPHTTILLSATALALALGAGCSDDKGPTSKPETGEPPAFAPIHPRAAPPRKFTERALFGALPVENLILDPTFDPDASAWIARASSGELVATSRRVLTHSPADQPALLVEKKGKGRHWVFGFAGGKPVPLSASVWVGRNAGGPEPVWPEVILLGADPEAPTHDVEYALEPEGEPIEQDGVRWQSFSGVAEPGGLGMMLLVLVDDEAEPLWVTGPLIADLASEMERRPERAPAPRISRANARPELSAAGRAAAEQVRRLGARPLPVR